MVPENNTSKVETKTTVEEKRARIRKEAIKYIVEPSTSPMLHISELLNKEFPEQIWLVDRLVPANAVTIFSGTPGSFKTRALLHLATTVSKGEPLFGHFPTQQSDVLVIDQESGERLLKLQLEQLGASKDMPIHYRSYQNFKLNDENVELIRRDCKLYGIKVVIFDSLIQIHNASENDASEMAPVMEYLRRLASYDITVLVIAHERKTGAFGRKGNSELRGSNAILGSVDAHISFINKKDQLIIEPTKLRFARPLKPFELLVTEGDDNSCNFEYIGDLVSTKESNENILKASVLELLGVHDKLNIKDMLENLKEAGVKANDHNLPKVLAALVKEGTIVQLPGVGNTKYYSLAPTA